ncbi:tyrosine-type recombinase/integrase [Lacrimispora sp.]|uniref:tyrosine-type recombinase/integrase n=1 Tax=Lacrimispora sp. TaxID=2719234 RepID=UPI0028AF6A58|nr:site-specific integrase [Lacrimispora sp.]
MRYKENPYDLKNDLTVKELYDAWLSKYISDNNLDGNRRKSYDAVFKYCGPAYNIKVVDFLPPIIEEHIKTAYKIGEKGNDAGRKIAATYIIKGNIKALYNLLFDYAVFRRIVTENYARTFTTNTSKGDCQKSREGRPYTKDELAILWDNSGDLFIDMIIVQCYSGWRPGEVIILAVNNIDLENRTYTGGVKTSNGINRTVPIHPKVLPIIQKYYDEAIDIGRPMLFGRTQKFHGSYRYIENSFRNSLLKKESELGILGHVLHDGRHTFSTFAKEYGVDEYARKKFMGHSIKDLTDRVYTHMDIEWFRTEIEKIL